MKDLDYYAPVRQPPPLPPQRVSRWVKIAALVVVCLALVITAGLEGLARYSLKLSRRGAAPARVLLGRRLKWRALAKPGPLLIFSASCVGSLAVGDFDADGDEEALIVREKNPRVFEASGKSRRAGIYGRTPLYVAAWDYDRDGICEIVPDYSNASGLVLKGLKQWQPKTGSGGYPLSTPVLSVAGEIIAELEGMSEWLRAPLVVDFTGDGRREIILNAPDDPEQFVVLGAQGQAVESFNVPEWQLLAGAGDVNGDGLDEVTFIDVKQDAVVAYGQDMHQQYFPLGYGSIEFRDSTLVDVTGDGIAEVISPALGYYDLASRSFIPFAFPEQAEPVQEPTASIAVCDLEGDGAKEIAVSASGFPFGNALVIFDAGGNCKYYEEFGDTVWDVARLRAGGQDHLAVQLTTRLLIYP